jgi:hypothetical protein
VLGAFLIAFIILVVVLVITVSTMISKSNAVSEAISESIDAEHVFVSAFDYSCLGVNFSKQKIAVGKKYDFQQYDFGQIVRIEVVRDDNVITSTNRGSQAIGALVGGVAFGGAGFLAGALSAKTRSTSHLRKLALRIVTEGSTYQVTFIDMGNSDHPPSQSVVQAMTTEGDRYYGYILNAMRQAEKNSPSAQSLIASSQMAPSRPGSADEVKKLWDLKEQGILSVAEFEAEQKKVLGSN